MLKKIICAGSGGQGVLTAGKLLLRVAHDSGLKVTWFPSYGNEMRGGTANCHLVLSSERIASPYVDHPDILMALNEAAVRRFLPALRPGAQLFVNSSLVRPEAWASLQGAGVGICPAPVSELAASLRNERAANLCMLGFIIQKTGLFTLQAFSRSLSEFFSAAGKEKYTQSNLAALEAGCALAA